MIPLIQTQWSDEARVRHSMAFTLIELLVVISVIALLIAIAMPALAKVRSQARGLVCQSSLRQWGMTFNLYTTENEDSLPGGFMSILWLLRGGRPSSIDPNAEGRRYHHFDTQGIAYCPSAKKPGEFGSFLASTSTMSHDGSISTVQISGSFGRTFNAWTITDPMPEFRGSYGYNDWLSRGFKESSRPNPWAKTSLLALKKLNNIPLLVDSMSPWSQPRDSVEPPLTEGRIGRSSLGAFCINRHSAHVNALFLDWSVRRVGLKELWTLKWYKDWDTANPWTQAGGVRPEDWPEWMRRFKDY
ncbi:MAG: prepilin-type N-terminal cleavage/methylation domain-containing protein [Planctomycetes bacterium]|nr:prepilin-type N-terminal cleavage/methylation domain-containing protein [Planctomycetota bacterium]